MISTKGRYAIRLMIDLAQQNTDKPVPLDDIADRQDISKKYLEIIVKSMVQGKLVKGISGKGGGYFLTRAPKDYTILELLRITEGSLSSVACLDCDSAEEVCPRASSCKTLPMWEKYDKITKDYFSGITLADLL